MLLDALLLNPKLRGRGRETTLRSGKPPGIGAGQMAQAQPVDALVLLLDLWAFEGAEAEVQVPSDDSM